VPQAILLILAGYPELWILKYPAHRYHAVPLPGFEPTTLWLRVRRPNHSATTLHKVLKAQRSEDIEVVSASHVRLENNVARSRDCI
jgi:hypothetical protein